MGAMALPTSANPASANPTPMIAPSVPGSASCYDFREGPSNWAATCEVDSGQASALVLDLIWAQPGMDRTNQLTSVHTGPALSPDGPESTRPH